MLPPDSAFKKVWNRVIVALTMYNMIFIILVVCYNRYDEQGLYWYEPNTGELNILPMVIDYMVDMIFLIDIRLTFITTFFDADNELVLDRKLIARNYRQSWFWVSYALERSRSLTRGLHFALLLFVSFGWTLRLTATAPFISLQSCATFIASGRPGGGASLRARRPPFP